MTASVYSMNGTGMQWLVYSKNLFMEGVLMVWFYFCSDSNGRQTHPVSIVSCTLSNNIEAYLSVTYITWWYIEVITEPESDRAQLYIHVTADIFQSCFRN